MSQKSGSRGPGDGDGQAPHAELGAGQRGADGARVEGRPAGVDPVVDARDDHVGPGPEPLDAGQDHRQGRRAVDAVGGDVGQAGDVDVLVGDGLALVDRARRRHWPRCGRSAGPRPPARARSPNAAWRPRASAAIPGAKTPSSLVIRMRMARESVRRRAAAGRRRQGRRARRDRVSAGRCGLVAYHTGRHRQPDACAAARCRARRPAPAPAPTTPPPPTGPHPARPPVDRPPRTP